MEKVHMETEEPGATANTELLTIDDALSHVLISHGTRELNDE